MLGFLLQQTSSDWSTLCVGLYVLFLGSSPHPSTPDEDDSQTELLIAEEKLSPEDEGQVMPRYENYSYRCEGCYMCPIQHRHHLKMFYIHCRFTFFILDDKLINIFYTFITIKLLSSWTVFSFASTSGML